MSKVTIVRAIVKIYFLGALAASFTHIVHAGHLLQMTTWEAYSLPLMIDGIAVIGMIMRADCWATSTRKIGFRVQVIAGLISLGANIYAGHTLGSRIHGAMIVAIYVLSEWLSDHMDSRQDEVVAEAQSIVEAEMTQAEIEAAALATKRSEAARKGAATKAARKAEAERDEKRRIRDARKALAAS